MTFDSTLAALDRLRGDVANLNAALVKHERVLAQNHQHDDGHRELYGFVSRITRVTADMKAVLAEPAPR
jgi:hypothetical protein